jgi:hypothetical protein
MLGSNRVEIYIYKIILRLADVEFVGRIKNISALMWYVKFRLY